MNNDAPEIPANLRAAVDDLREYINPPRDVTRARTLRKRGDDATAAESDELVALADAAQGRASIVARWIMGPNLDEISATQTAFLRRLAAKINNREVCDE